VLEDDDGGGPFGGPIDGHGERVSAIEADAVLTLVVENVAPESWEEEGVSIDLAEGVLVVVHRPDVQRDVARFLTELSRW
jgi:hypothetical protein